MYETRDPIEIRFLQRSHIPICSDGSFRKTSELFLQLYILYRQLEDRAEYASMLKDAPST